MRIHARVQADAASSLVLVTASERSNVESLLESEPPLITTSSPSSGGERSGPMPPGAQLGDPQACSQAVLKIPAQGQQSLAVLGREEHPVGSCIRCPSCPRDRAECSPAKRKGLEKESSTGRILCFFCLFPAQLVILSVLRTVPVESDPICIF